MGIIVKLSKGQSVAENKIDMAHDNSGLASSGDHNNLTQQNHSGSGDSVGNNKIVIDKLIVQNLPQTPQEPQKDIPYSLAIPPNFTQPHYITRTIDNTINEIIQTQLHQMVVINAEGGYGKSTLIENLFQRYTDTPMIVINKQSQADTNLVDLLMDAEFSTMQNTPNLNSLKKQYIDSQVHEIELLDALQKDFTNYGVFIVDTFEKIKGVDISSYVNFGTHQIERRKEVRHSRLKDYIESLFSTLLGNASFIVAGRNDLREINFEKIDDGFLQELTIEGFSDENIVEYFKRSNIEIPNKEMIAEINTLTRSNPLLITLLPKIIKEYDSGWSELDIEEMRRRVERDEQYGLLFYLTDRVLSHIDSSIELYPLIITRVLNRNIEKLLYWETKVLDRLVESGLAYRGKGKENELYYLHDSVAAAIVADTKREYQQNYSSYHDNPKIRQLHQAFIEYYQDYQNVYNINLALEIGYHTVLLKQNFEGTFNVEREVFIKLLLGTMSLVNNEKVHICKNFENLSKFYIEELNRILTEEESQWLKLFSPALYQELKRLSQMGKLPIANIGENIFGLKQKSQFKLHWDNDIQFLLMLNSKECLQKRCLLEDSYRKCLFKKQ
ncbi:MAG: hypothetical protein U9N49_02685 [Campylobacterota bacterium]|nr:hypothetical protein [Campylobacterota bacterium]